MSQLCLLHRCSALALQRAHGGEATGWQLQHLLGSALFPAPACAWLTLGLVWCAAPAQEFCDLIRKYPCD